MPERVVFMSEADDDLQRERKLDTRGLVRCLHCYVLLADRVVLHPAYVWQSQETNALVMGHTKSLFQPDVFQILLGDSSDVAAYIRQRMEVVKPTADGTRTRECITYERWGRELQVQAKQLDERFPRGSALELEHSRAKEFRQLLEADVRPNAFPDSIYSLLRRYCRTTHVSADLDQIIEDLGRFIREAHLVSTDTFPNKVVSLGLADVAEDTAFRRRLLWVYYYSNVLEGAEIPGLPADRRGIVDPFDAEVFWAVFRGVFGEVAEELLSGNPVREVAEMIVRLRDRCEWHSFREAYFDVVTEMERALLLDASVSRAIEERMGLSELEVTKRIWREGKIDIAQAAASAVAGPFGPLWATCLALTSVTATVHSIARRAGRYREEYKNHDLAYLRRTITDEVSRIAHKLAA